MLAGLVLGAFALLLVRCAWVSDDAFITLRTVDNALHGLGLRWNPAERVQSYTHPLWMLLLLVAHAVSGEPYYGTLVLCGITSLAAMGALWLGVARSPAAALAASVPLLGSKAFVDFGTSGLENPLTHLLLALVVLSALRGGDRPADLFRTALLTALAMLVRLDLVLLFAPVLAVHAARSPRTRAHLGALIVGFAPLVAWEAFAFVYYGSLVPNTAYAKLGTGIPRSEMIAQGFTYLVHAARYDRVTLWVLACGVVPLATVREPAVRALLGGALAYVLYVVWIGGDFMAGRFLTAPMFAASLAISRVDAGPWVAGLAAALPTALAALSPNAPMWSGADYVKIPAWEGIVDERGYYHHGAGLWSSKRPMSHAFAREGRQARRAGRHTEFRAAVGYFGYYAGPQVHIVDPLGLNDPLLSRIPARYTPSWRVGHYRRELPRRYDPGNDVPPEDSELAALYARVRHITRGPLLDLSRLTDAASLQLFGPAIDPWRWRFPEVVVRAEHESSLLGPVDARGTVVHVSPPRVLHPTITADPGQHVQVLYARDHRVLATHAVDATGEPQALPESPAGTELVFVFPQNRGQRVNLRALDLGPEDP
ncbi:MAG: hypothetical protein R3F61_36770 [Myxococcota bacterium]